MAGRLAEADPELSILVIEGGQNNFDVPSVVNPLLVYKHLLPTSKTALFYKAKASEHLAGRESIVPAGGKLTSKLKCSGSNKVIACWCGAGNA